MQDFIHSWVQAHEAQFLADVARVVAVRSVKEEALPGKPFGAGPAAALAEALAICAEQGLAVKNWENYVGTADLGPADDRALDILSHLDVVGEGTGWDTDPYTAVVKDGCIFGRGTDDDKGPSVAAIYAMRCVLDSGVPLKRGVRLIMGTDEESGGEDIAYYYAREKSAPATFSPDAGFPVFNVEKGSYKPRFRQDFAPSQALPRVTALKGGYRVNVVPPEAEATVAGLTDAAILAAAAPAAERLGVALRVQDGCLHVDGLSAHASTPEEGNNALTALLAILAALPLADCPSTAAIRSLARLYPHGDFLGRAVGIAQADQVAGELTCAFTLLELDEAGAKGQLDCRVPPCADETNCAAVCAAAMAADGWQVKGRVGAAHVTPADTPFVQTLLRCYEQYTGEKGQCLSMGGGTYVHDIEGGVAFGAHMADFDTRLHGPNERARISDLLVSIEIFAQVILDMCKD